ncbi:MAG TPA: hypothetical protein VN256_09865 [Pyrinomonadaceae bacterium]|nr:hypothetical protein [Pyrinomonadaceae bacterium]
MLHVHNGDCSADVLRRSGLPGEHLVWREALIAGPTPAAVSADEWRDFRARHLADAYGGDFEECKSALAAQEESLGRFPEHEEVVLWFEHDLFCQTLLVYLLDWFSRRELGATKLSLVCVGEFPGVPDFRGLGQLTPPQMASLFETRSEVTDAELSLGAEAWRAYSSPDPRAVEELLAADTSALPYLRGALLSHLARFPSTRNGLGRVENLALELIDSGHADFPALFQNFGRAEGSYGLGDAQFWNDLRRLAEAGRPLLVVDGPAAADEARGFADKTFKLTAFGEDVRAGRGDFVHANGIDAWLGGVHLFSAGRELWRWNEQDRKLEK